MSEIKVDQAVIDYVMRSGKDYRVSTDCSGPVLMPTEMKPPKDSDLKVKAGMQILYISRVQARYIARVTLDMLYDPSRSITCSMYDEP